VAVVIDLFLCTLATYTTLMKHRRWTIVLSFLTIGFTSSAICTDFFGWALNFDHKTDSFEDDVGWGDELELGVSFELVLAVLLLQFASNKLLSSFIE
jgi:hypothetical protein